MRPVPRIAIVIVNYRTPELVKACLDSLAQEASDTVSFQVFVGDADSQDGSVDIIGTYLHQQDMGKWVVCFDIGKNGGFAYGNNAVYQTHVMSDSGFDYVYFLNPDTYILPGAVQSLVAFLESHRDVGVAGSRLENPDGSARAYGFRFPKPWREFFRGARFGVFEKLVPSASVKIRDLTQTCAVDWVTGASFMMPCRVLDEVGLMDDGYFLYFEETDLMVRVRAAGYAVWHVAESRVVHLAGQATGVRSGDREIKRISAVWLQSRARFMRKHYGTLQYHLATVLFLSGNLMHRVKCLLLRRATQDPPYLWRDYLADMLRSRS